MIQETSSGAWTRLAIMGDASKSRAQDGIGGGGENKSIINKFECGYWEVYKLR